ncbi:glycosyltransferase family 4 protein [Gordonia alkanivorans]
MREYSDSETLVSFGNDRDRDWETYWLAAGIIVSSLPSARIVGQGDSTVPRGGGRNAFLRVGRLSHVDVRRWYGESAVVGIATRENLHASGMTVALEAMASGRPVVMTRTPGIEDYVLDGITGRLVDPGDYVGFAEAVLAYMRDPDLAKLHGINGRERVVQSFNTRAMCSSISEIVGLGRCAP